jgi:hypothetical protein
MKSYYCKTLDMIVDLIPKCGYSTFGGFVLLLDNHDTNDYIFDGDRNIISRHHADRYKNEEKRKINEAQKFKSKPRLTIVRNPYARILSAFSNKKHKLSGFSRDNNRSYDEFLKIISFLEHSGSESNLNDHFKAQTSQIYNLDKYEKIFSLEVLEFYEFVKSHDLDNRKLSLLENYCNKNIIHNVTNSVEKFKTYLDDQTCSKILNIYKNDFEFLGYSKDPNDLHLPPGA